MSAGDSGLTKQLFGNVDRSVNEERRSDHPSTQQGRCCERSPRPLESRAMLVVTSSFDTAELVRILCHGNDLVADCEPSILARWAITNHAHHDDSAEP